MSWAERAAEQSPSVQRSRARSIQKAQQFVDAARRLILIKGDDFTTQEVAKEAGAALQTFYRCFAGGKDQLLLAVLEDLMVAAARRYAIDVAKLPDPISRLRYLVGVALSALDDDESIAGGARFITSQHYRLHQLYPEELATATRPYTDLLAVELRAADESGALNVVDPDWSAAALTRMTTSTYHYYAFARADESVEEITEHVWSFCLHGLGVPAHHGVGVPTPGLGSDE